MAFAGGVLVIIAAYWFGRLGLAFWSKLSVGGRICWVYIAPAMMIVIGLRLIKLGLGL